MGWPPELETCIHGDAIGYCIRCDERRRIDRKRRERKAEREKTVKKSVTLNLSTEEALALRLLLKEVRSNILLQKHVRKWNEGPNGSTLKKLNTLLGKQR